MEHLIGETVTFQTKRKPMKDKSLTSLFLEHVFSATIVKCKGDFVIIKDVKLLLCENNCEGKDERKLPLLAKDKLFCNRDIRINEKNNTCLVKIKNNLYFDVYVYNQNIDLLKSIETHTRVPKLYDICFYNLNSMELNFARDLLNIY